MQFTPQETKWIETIRKQERRWRIARWVILSIGIFSATLCVTFGYFLHQYVLGSRGGEFDAGDVFVIVLLWTKCCMYFFAAVWCFSTTCFRWHGDMNRRLLLKLVDAQQKEPTKGERGD